MRLRAFIPVRPSGRDILDAYRIRAGDPRGLWVMSGRMSPDRQEEINDKLLSLLALSSSDTLLDIGCGDASLLRKALPYVRTAMGIVPSDEELARLRAEVAGIEFRRSDAADLQLDRRFSRIVANGVLHLVGSPRRLAFSLRGIAVLADPNARIVIGEFPAKRAPSRAHRSAFAAILFARRRRGNIFALSYARHLIRRPAALYVRPSRFFLAYSPEQFAVAAHAAGLEILEVAPSHETSHDLPRFDYLLQRKHAPTT